MERLMDDMTVFISIGLLAALAIWFLFFRRRQSVRLTDETPIRPHMVIGEGKGLTDEAAAAASDVLGHILKTQVHDQLPGAAGAPDDLKQLKGVGPKMATMLHDMGIHRFDQIAKLSDAQVDAIDAQLGAFKGRFARDRIVEQADYLGRGDIDGYEAKFGKL